ncbi:hypothetical protein Taro_031759, partial [Colocasia esculenta]|nr:hypothetical protein [Colocasia esculenta]
KGSSTLLKLEEAEEEEEAKVKALRFQTAPNSKVEVGNSQAQINMGGKCVEQLCPCNARLVSVIL